MAMGRSTKRALVRPTLRALVSLNWASRMESSDILIINI